MPLTLIFLMALATTLIVMEPLRRLLLASGHLDRPNHRSAHAVPVPRGGGLGCALGLSGGWLAGLFLDVPLPTTSVLAGLLLAAIGLADDRWTLGSVPRLAAQVLIGAGVGLGFDVWWGLGGAVIFMLVVNSINFMDGVNGITSFTILVWSASMTWVGLTYDIPSVAALGVLTGATALGFLPWNVPSAQLFLGDVGSYLFGGVVAAGTVSALSGGAPVGMVLAPLSIYLFDVLVTLLVRTLKRRPLTEAHRDHIYQVLSRQLGGKHVLIAAIVAGLSAALVVVHATLDPMSACLATAVVLAAYAGLPYFLRQRRGLSRV